MDILFMTGSSRVNAFQCLLDHDENVIGVLVPEISHDRFKPVVERADESGIPVVKVPESEESSVVRDFDPDILVSCGYSYLLDKETLEIPKYPINVHPSLLPKYRGPYSGPYVIINGEGKTGVTVHFLTEEMDAGDIIIQREIPLTPFDTTESMKRKTRAVEGEVLCEAIERLKSGNFTRTPQDESEATTYTEKREPEDSEIDWNKPLKELYDEIRACDPDKYPAFFHVNGEKVCIKLWREDKDTGEEDMI